MIPEIIVAITVIIGIKGNLEMVNKISGREVINIFHLWELLFIVQQVKVVLLMIMHLTLIEYKLMLMHITL